MVDAANLARDALAALLADDALARWGWLVERRERAIEQLRGPNAGRDYWTAGAARFPRASDGTGPEPVRDYLLARIEGAETVLDVGAGTGRFALPLARVAKSVVAVEPSAAMVAVLREEVARWGAKNLRIVPDPWMEARVEPADIVLCANVLTPIADIGPFLMKLKVHARRACYIVLRAPSPDAPLVTAWREVHGSAYPREPGYIDALAALDALGIPAQLTLVPSPTVWREGFETVEDLERLVRSRLWMPDQGVDPDADRRLTLFLEHAAIEREGRHYLPSGDGHAAIIWWRQ